MDYIYHDWFCLFEYMPFKNLMRNFQVMWTNHSENYLYEVWLLHDWLSV